MKNASFITIGAELLILVNLYKVHDESRAMDLILNKINIFTDKYS